MIVNKKQWDNAFEGVKNLKYEEIILDSGIHKYINIDTLEWIPVNNYQYEYLKSIN